MNYTITPVQCGPFTRYQLRRGAEYIGEFPNLATCEAMRDASEKAGADDFTRGYIECIYFTDTGEDEQPASDAPLSADALASIIHDCESFKAVAALPLAHAYAHFPDYGQAQAGRDFWFTRNGHGVGFRDRGLGAVGDDLSRDARKFGEAHVYLNDDGSIGVE